jgi:hypothetical protein
MGVKHGLSHLREEQRLWVFEKKDDYEDIWPLERGSNRGMDKNEQS